MHEQMERDKLPTEGSGELNDQNTNTKWNNNNKLEETKFIDRLTAEGNTIESELDHIYIPKELQGNSTL